jgi:3-oxoacyl-[acyl-carrier protein] reductase
MSDTPLAGKTALVTGGSRGIGAATALRLAAAGADVAISYAASDELARDVVASVEAAGRHGMALRADQADPVQVRSLVETAAQRLGGLDILVNNAGVFVTGQVDDDGADLAAFDRQFAINVGGVASATRAAARVMGEGGRIVSISVVEPDRARFPGIGDYMATKAAVVAYTRAWARDLGPRGITVNAVQTSSIETDMNPATGPFADVQRSMMPLGRYGRPEELAAAVAFLVGPDAAYITGATLDVDGGFAA